MLSSPKQAISFSDATFARFQKLILDRTGINFGERRRNELQRHISAYLTKRSLSDNNALYTKLLNHPTNSSIWEDFIDRIIVRETYFFREKQLFKALREDILPEIIASHQQDRSIRIWSAGCSTGEEPYSLSILLDQLLGHSIHQWRIFILATDINKPSLKQGIEGIYRSWALRQTSDDIIAAYFQKKDALFHIREDIQSRVMFSYLNLKDPVYPALETCTHAMDLILWRNVAIYFSETVIIDVLKRFYQALIPSGYFNIGASEAAHMGTTPFVSKPFPGAFVYQKMPADTQHKPLQHKPLLTQKIKKSQYKKPSYVFKSPQNKTKTSTKSPQSKAETSTKSLLEAAKEFTKKRDYIQAITSYQSYLEKHQKDANGWYLLARVYANSGDLEQAKHACICAIDHDPLLVEAYYLSGLINEEDGTLEQAILDYKKTLYLQADFVLAHYHLSIVYQQLQDENQAERHRIQAIRILSRRSGDEIIPGADDLTVAQLLSMIG